LFLQNLDRLHHRGHLLWLQTAARGRLARCRHGLIVESARNADARALQRIALQKIGVVAAGGRAQFAVAGSFGSGIVPSSTPSMIAASVTVFAIGPGVS
jgi:hypothetical protein